MAHLRGSPRALGQRLSGSPLFWYLGQAGPIYRNGYLSWQSPSAVSINGSSLMSPLATQKNTAKATREIIGHNRAPPWHFYEFERKVRENDD